ncbi:uncharacterized protein DS421_2g59050 [Arachis hypogaea]|nr:uncharacterized protein DS421_2g59050 [Arachis hypogaea]
MVATQTKQIDKYRLKDEEVMWFQNSELICRYGIMDHLPYYIVRSKLFHTSCIRFN